VNNRWLDKPEIGGLRIWILVILLVHAADVSRRVIANDRPAPHPYVQVPFEDYIHRHYRTSEDLPSNWIYDVLQTRDGYIWIATHNGVARFDGTKFTIFNRANTPQMPANDTRVLYETSDGSLWIGTVGGLVEYRPGRPGTFHEIEAYRGNSIHAIWEDRTDKLWLGTREETWSRAPGHEFKVEKHAPIHVKAICEDRKGALWLGSDSGVYKSEGTGFQQIANDWLPAPSGASGGIPAAGVNVLLADDNGGVWAGTNQGLLYIKDGQISDRGSEVGRQQIYDMLQTSNGELYVATRYGLQRSVGGQGFEKLLSDELASCLMEDQEGGLWAGYYGNRGLHRYEIGKSTTILSEYRVNCVHENPDGTMWFGSTSGLLRLRDGVITDYGTADGLPDVRVQTIAQGAGETLWIGTRKGFARWSGTGLSTDVTPADTARMNISSAFEDSAGVLWFALRSGGGYALQDGTLRGLDALNHGTISWFYEYSNSELWIGHEYGLYCYRDDQIQQVIDPALDRLNSSHFVCHYATKEKTLWLGTSGGIVRWESGQFDVFTSEDGLAADYIEGVKVDGKPLIAVDQFDFRSGPKRLAIEFAAPTFSNPKLAQVKYRLDGYDQDWIDAGEERAAYYTDLGPGEYRFRVIAANGDGVWNEEGVSVPFTVRPRWWETGFVRPLAWQPLACASCTPATGLGESAAPMRRSSVKSLNVSARKQHPAATSKNSRVCPAPPAWAS
jgi:ligand-binding sensor domain-containing protein